MGRLRVIAAFVWHAFAKDSGTPAPSGATHIVPAAGHRPAARAVGHRQPQPALGAIADAFHRTLWAIFLIVSVLIAILAITIGVVAANILTISPLAALAVTAVCLIITTVALIPARLFAVARARVTNRIDAAHEARMQSLLMALAPGENLMLHFADRENPAGQILAATNQRLLLAAPTGTGTDLPDRARSASSTRHIPDSCAEPAPSSAGRTHHPVHFRDRPGH